MRRFGSEVTLIDHGNRVLKLEDSDVSDARLELLHDEGIKALLRSSVTCVSDESGRQGTLDVDHEGQRKMINATHILVTTKRVPNTLVNLRPIYIRKREWMSALACTRQPGSTAKASIHRLGSQ